MEFKIDARKLRKVLQELIADVDSMPKGKQQGGHVRGIGAAIGKVGNYYISIEVDEFDSADIAIFSEVIVDLSTPQPAITQPDSDEQKDG